MNKYDFALQVVDKYTSEVAVDEARNHPLHMGGAYAQAETTSNISLTLTQLMDDFGPFPIQSAIFGLCEDNLPILLDLTDPISGSVMILAAPDGGKTNLLKSILWSLIEINSPKEVSFILISPDLDKMGSLRQQPHCVKSCSPYLRESSELIIQLSAIAEQRRSGRQRGPAMVLAIDDLAYFASDNLDGDVIIYLKQLIKAGPKSQIFTIATVNPGDMAVIHPTIASAFKTRILGNKMGLHPLSKEFAPSSAKLPVNHFGLKLRNEFVRFSVPTVSY